MSKNLNEIPEIYQKDSFAMYQISKAIKELKSDNSEVKIRIAEDNSIIIESIPEETQIIEGRPTLQFYQKKTFKYDNEENLISNHSIESFLLTDAYGNQIDTGRDHNAKVDVSRQIRVWNKDHVEVSRTNLENQSKAQAKGNITAKMVDNKIIKYANITELDRHITELNGLLPETDDYGNLTSRSIGGLAQYIADECKYTKMTRDSQNKEKIFCNGCIMDSYNVKATVNTVARANMEHPEQTTMRVDERVFDELHQQYQQDINNRNQEVGRGGR